MVLIGMLDSPYVRRVAISLRLMGLAYEHRALSVFRDYDAFAEVNPVVKAPSFVCDDGAVLMDSTLILDHVETLVAPERRLMPSGVEARREALRLVGLAMAACEKCVQIVYEHEQRPPEKRHEPWLMRVTAQANAAFAELEKSVERAKPWLQGGRMNAADVAVACAWRFGQFYDAKEIRAADYPGLAAYSRRAEALAEFVATPLA
jgi:glutathione S-transferase